MMMPAIIGCKMPELLPNAFCTPTHVPAAFGPANIWAIAYRLSDSAAVANPARQSKIATGIDRSAKTRPNTATALTAWLDTIIQRRMNASDRPDRVHRSDA